LNPVESKSDALDSAGAEGDSSKREPLPTWSEDFDPVAFIADNLKGCTSHLDALSLEELRKLAAGTGLKCLALNQIVYVRQEKEASEKLQKEVRAAKEDLEKDLADQLAKSQAGFNKSLAKKKKKISALRKEKRNLTTVRNAMIVALVKIWRDANKRDDDMSKLHAAAERLDGDLKELEEENDELKENMASKYVAGFQAAIEQVRVLFPEIDSDVLAQADFLKKIEDGKLVSRLLA
jgi:chromosome segregation ATPase